MRQYPKVDSTARRPSGRPGVVEACLAPTPLRRQSSPFQQKLLTAPRCAVDPELDHTYIRRARNWAAADVEVIRICPTDARVLVAAQGRSVQGRRAS